MHAIPLLSPVFLSAADYATNFDVITMRSSETFQARVAYLERCAEAMKKFIDTSELTDAEIELHQCIMKVLQERDYSVNELAQTHFDAIIQTVFEQHLLECDVSEEEDDEIRNFLTNVMNTRTGADALSMFENIIQSHEGKEYTAGVFAIVNDMIAILNTWAPSRIVH